MSTISCDACDTLRQQAPEFVQQGVTDNVAASLKNNTGLNPALTVLHDNCTDLNNVNDCLIGRMGDEIKAYDNCDWKEYMGKFTPNLYETLKAIIASGCGLWTKLCVGLDTLLDLIRGDTPQRHVGTWTEEGYAALRVIGGWEKEKYTVNLAADILEGIGCTDSKRIGRWGGFSIGYRDYIYPAQAAWYMVGASIGMPIAYWRKQAIVPLYMTEAQWNNLMRGYNVKPFCTLGGANAHTVYMRVRGYIVFSDGHVYNQDLQERFGADVMVVEPAQVVGGDGASTFEMGGDMHGGVSLYDA